MKKFFDLDYQYQRLLKGIKDLPNKDRIISALDLAKKAHAGQKRDEGQDYFIHPVRVANTLVSDLSIKDSDLIVAAILHDTVEDTDTTLQEIKGKFGEKVAYLVKKLTREKQDDEKEENKFAQKYKKFQELMKQSNKVRLLKACDLLDNLGSLPYRKDRGRRFFRHVREAREMYLPLAKSVNTYIASKMEKIIKTLPKLKD
ncbi:hypothetical protein COY23_01980 [bacterium (Candidatus Torokbacteria) CG_4_10_14_0_2_um_filter_35_8]|nr:MAG: hypothetical protein COY23_01980 [bacterium (Candidatus Torokbacteria) CG_4_10_14_0_2_um_filter_35_8]